MQINGLSRPDDLKGCNLVLTPQQGKLLKCLMDDARSIKDQGERFLAMKYWFIRAWEEAESEGKETREIVNQWRGKKKEILNNKVKSFIMKSDFNLSEKFCHCPKCNKQITPAVVKRQDKSTNYACPECLQHFSDNDKDYEIKWLDW